jgi:cytochrome c oxidase subunit 4
MNDEQLTARQHREATSRLTYVLVFVVLLVLLALTVVADQVKIGVWNAVISTGIAFAKAALIVTFFMHLKGAASIVKGAAGAGLVWLSIAITLTMTEGLSRGWHDPAPSALQSDARPHAVDRFAPGPEIEPASTISGPPTVHEDLPPD